MFSSVVSPSNRVAFVILLALASAPALFAAEQPFQRGDVNADGELDLADAIHTLTFLFLGAPERVACEDATDANDDGEVDVADPVRLLLHLFLDAPAPPAPFGACGEDPTTDAIGCNSFDPCPVPAPPPPAPPVLEPPPSPTRADAIDLRGTAGAGLRVQITGGTSPLPVEALAGPDGRFSALVTLNASRLNRLFALVVDAEGRASAPAAVEVIQDSTPPFVFIDEPADGARLLVERATIAGRVSDLLSGFLGLAVTVNGAPAAIVIGIGTNGTFERQDVPLALGANTITVTAADAVGNTATREIRITREEPPPASDRLELVSGNGQAPRPIHSTLPEPIVVRALKADGTPLAGKLVTFKVVRSDGRLASSHATAPVDRFMTLAVRTGADGIAQAYWTLGSDAGCGNNRVKAAAAGLTGEVRFAASAAPGPASQINIGTGNDQRGEAGAPGREALKAWVSDGCNGIAGVPVTFRVRQGSGKVDGASSVTVPTGPTGHAQVSFVFGPEAGNQAIEASFDGNLGAPAVFRSYAVVRDPPRPTTFGGLLLDNAAQPIQGAICLLEVPGFEGVQVPTDVHGRFEITAPAAGPASLRIEGSFATHVGGPEGQDVPPGSFPSLTYEVTLVPNAENSLPAPVLLPPLDPDNAVVYDGTSAVTLRVKGVEGLEMQVAAGTTVTLRDGKKVGPGHPGSVSLSLNQVHHDDVPMPMTDGAAPPFAWTLQPAGARFEPPVRVKYPNLSSLPPGAIANFLTYNHDTAKFEIVSSGQVSNDGSTINSDPGSGISVSGWGGNCPPYSATAPVVKCEVDVTLKEKEQILCTGQPAKLRAIGGPAPGTLSWVSGGVPPSGSMTFGPGFGSVLLDFETTFTTPGEKTITASWSCPLGEVKTATTKVKVVDMQLHPLDEDFGGLLAKTKGRVMISTQQDDKYYTTVNTTIAGKPAQTADAKVTITAHLTPANDFTGKTIYFRVLDPDADDRSPYEVGALGGDNRDPAVQKGILSAAGAITLRTFINGNEVAAAEVVLTITSQYSGDNYQVEASLDSSFKTVCAKSAVLTAWKRIYLEQDNMYQLGATLTADFTADADSLDDVLTIDDSTDFTVGDSVIVFSRTSIGTPVTVKAKAAGSVTVGDLVQSFPMFSGVKLVTGNSTFTAGTDFLTQGYGDDTEGMDGGTFVEYVLDFAGSGSIPKYGSFPNDGDVTSFAFCNFWFDNAANKSNVHQLVAADRHADGSFGTANEMFNICFVTTGNFVAANKQARVSESVVHELAHLFNVANGHVDMTVNAPNHEGTDQCNMSYNRVRDNSIVEFDTDCLYDIRDATDPR